MIYDWSDGHMGAGGWLLASLLCFLLLTILVVGIVAVVRSLGAPTTTQRPGPPTAPVPEEILRMRLARGEIDPSEYERLAAVLHPRTESSLAPTSMTQEG